jgi:SAM-dependent methyltransferase
MNQLAVRVMREAGVDIAQQQSKHVSAFEHVPLDFVVTVCDVAHEACPFLATRATVLHAGFDDPPRLARGAASEEEALGHYRRVRDEIRAFVQRLPAVLAAQGTMTHGETMMATTASACCEGSGCCQPAVSAQPAGRVGAQGAAQLAESGRARAGEQASEQAGKQASKQGSEQANEESREHVRDQVREGYAKIAQGGCCGPSGAGGGCCGATAFTPEQLAQAIGYSASELAAMPESANMGLSCGNPTAIASLREGEVVLDLGAGGGFDCFVAGPKVGRAGRVIGVDMTPDMVGKARRNIAVYREKTGLNNVEFRLGEIEALPVPDASVDVVISNCVLNLSPEKQRVWKEIARVLRPGGRVAVSDMALLRELPPAVQQDVEALVGCIAGAELVSTTREQMERAGLTSIELRTKPEYIDALTNWEDPLYRSMMEKLPKGSKPSEYVTSLDISARKAHS